jgi:hypothetical protein
MLYVLNFSPKVLLQARDMGYAKIRLKKESIGKMDRCPKEEKRKKER